MKKLLFILVLLLCCKFIFAQSISGVVHNESNLPLSNVNIQNISNGDHTHSNEKGQFTFQNINLNDTLQFSHVSYKTINFTVYSIDEPLKVTLKQNLLSLDEIVILPKINALDLINDIDIETNPVNSSQDILRQVPGLIIGQHAGGGKAEQIFLRGFDIDHGTDINITVDGVPVNMVSHAHGQGYADLHFVIPEIINNIDFGKGPYYANQGNFNTAGYVNFNTKDRLENSLIKLEGGQFNSNRVVGLFNLVNNQQHHAYIASEYISTDGAFESPQNFNRMNLIAQYSGYINNSDKVSVSASHFSSSWDASGQIPQRAVDNGSITRFGAIDDTEGGETSRTNFVFKYNKHINENSYIKNMLYLSNYKFDLYSNFTFFLNDSLNGDQIKQTEDRNIYGIQSEYNYTFSGHHLKGYLQAGINLRNDQISNIELSHTLSRKEIIDRIQLGDINETNYSTYLNTSFEFGKFSINPSVRFDYFDFQYVDVLLSEYETQTSEKSIISPKLNILYNPTKNLQVYLKAGKGFHSNDTRVILSQTGKKVLPAAYGSDLGFIWKPFPRLLINTAYWYLFLEQEFVYVGDEGVVEPSGETQRQGIDLSIRYQALDWLFWNFDANYTLARAMNEPAGANYIPLAPDLTMTTGLNIIHKSGIYGGINLRHIDHRPANEDNSIVALGYTVIDANVGYNWKKFDFSVQIQNILNTEWNETQFATETRLQNELNPVEEIHFIPGTPFFAKASVSYKF